MCVALHASRNKETLLQGAERRRE